MKISISVTMKDDSRNVCEKAVELCEKISKSEPELHFIVMKSGELYDENRCKSMDTKKNRIIVTRTPEIAVMNKFDKSEIVYHKAIVNTN